MLLEGALLTGNAFMIWFISASLVVFTVSIGGMFIFIGNLITTAAVGAFIAWV